VSSGHSGFNFGIGTTSRPFEDLNRRRNRASMRHLGQIEAHLDTRQVPSQNQIVDGTVWPIRKHRALDLVKGRTEADMSISSTNLRKFRPHGLPGSTPPVSAGNAHEGMAIGFRPHAFTPLSVACAMALAPYEDTVEPLFPASQCLFSPNRR